MLKTLLLVAGIAAMLLTTICWRVNSSASATPSPPCGDSYGSPSNIRAIEEAMLRGDARETTAAINNGKQTRGDRVGCGEAAYPYNVPNFAEPSLTTIAERWKTVHAPRFDMYRITCPDLGRNLASAVLGAYMARLAGDDTSLQPLAEVARMIEAQQYSARVAPAPLVAPPGVFGFVSAPSEDTCRLRGVPGEGVEAVCQAFPQLCIVYTGGLFAGRRFAIADTKPEIGLFDGGMAFDQGWAGVMMIESALQQTNPDIKARFLSSALLAGNWAVAEPAVRNHNYTAKLVWLLAELYGLTGDPAYRNALLDKVKRNLQPGVLMDLNKDGLVDGMDNRPFSRLTVVAQRPGRMWDGHNALPWYGAMNAVGMIEAYVSLRDRGDAAEAEELRPYAVAMLDNLSWELINLGVGSPDSPGFRDIPVALLLGLYKIAAYENDPRPQWEQAAWALWNAGLANAFGSNTINTGLYLLYKSGVRYVPLRQRVAFTLSSHVSAASFEARQLAPESIATAFGVNLAPANATASTLPLPVELMGTTLTVLDSVGVERPAPLFFVSPLQVNYEIPLGTATGEAIITSYGRESSTALGRVNIATVAPGLFTANARGNGAPAAVAIRILADGSQRYEPIVTFDPGQNLYVLQPIDLGAAGEQVFLILYGTGIRGRSSLDAVNVRIGGERAKPDFAGPSEGFVGLDQINVQLPRALARQGEVEVVLTVDGKTSNAVRLRIK